MIQRATDDRRVKKIKVAVDNRKTRRRQEDKDNIKAYYAVLGLSIGTFIIIGLLSLAKGF
tara:strand:- start:141 stop:320 length:180 start_codon:yes stop_codon:yes gene_type:complete